MRLKIVSTLLLDCPILFHFVTCLYCEASCAVSGAGEARILRKAEINRINALCDQLEVIKSSTKPRI